MSTSHPVPLHTVLADLGRLGVDVAFVEHPGPRWVRLDAFATDTQVLEAGLRRAGARFGRPEPTAASGSWLIADIAAMLAWPAVAGLLTHDTLLVSAVTHVYLPAPNTERRLAARLTPPDLLRAAAPDAFAAGMIATLQPVVEAVHERTRRGRHALWATVTDMVAAAFHRVGDHLDRSDHARHLATTVIDGSATLVGGANWHDLVWSGGTSHTRIRNICCLWYQTPTGDVCLTCPRITDQQRRDLLEQRAR